MMRRHRTDSTIQSTSIAVLAVLVFACTLPCAHAEPLNSTQQRDLVAEALQAVEKKLLLQVATDGTPKQAPDSKQSGASSASASATSLVEGSSFGELLGFALETGGGQGLNGQSYSFNLNPFSLLAASQPRIVEDPTEYAKHATLRRFEGKLELGGKGIALDTDGDGKPNDALAADGAGDIVGFELRVRVDGSRDRRDPGNFQLFKDRIGPKHAAAQADIVAIVGLIEDDVIVDEATFKAWLASESVRPLLERTARSRLALRDEMIAVARVVDNSPVWTLVAGRTARKDGFGPDEWRLGVRYVRGQESTGLNHTFNVDFRHVDALADEPDQKSLKAGYQASILALKGSGLFAEGVTVALSGALEFYRDVPDARHDTVAKLNAKLELPIRAGIKLPLSVTWANHRDLLSDESDVIGHFGFTFDLADALGGERKKAAQAALAAR